MRTMIDLNSMMEFDHVIEVLDDGSIVDRSDIIAPSLFDGQLDSSDWILLNGFSGQYCYGGPIMHPSEYIGGGIADYIVSNPGIYVSLVSYCDSDDGDDLDVDGWAIAYRKEMK